MRALLHSLFGQASPSTSPQADWVTLSGDGPIYVIGDVHGQLRLLRDLEAAILDHARKAGDPLPVQVVLLGDYVDRGPDSAGTLDYLTAPPPPGLERIALRGNHDLMFAEFLENPHADAPWLDFGGQETLASYGLWPEALKGPARHIAARLAAHIPNAHRDWLIGLADGAQSADHIFVHAGIDPDRPLPEQGQDILLWMRDPFLSHDRPLPDGRRVVHGHTPTPDTQPQLDLPHRIGLDTGAGFGGPLTAVRLDGPSPPQILQIR